MKIAIIIRRLNVMGGAQRQAIFLARILRTRGYTVALYTFLPPGEGAYADLLRGIRVVALGWYPQSRNALWDFFAEHRAARALARLIDSDTDVLNPHDQVAFQTAAYFKRHVRCVPSVWMMNDLPTRAFGAHRDDDRGGMLRQSWIKKIMARMIDTYEIATCIRAQDAIAVLDERDRGWVKSFFQRDAAVVRSGIDAAEFSFVPRSRIDDTGRIKILAVGIVFPHRRFEDLLAAIALMRARGTDASCTIVGAYRAGDPYYQKLMRARDDLRLRDVVCFAGKVSEEELRRRYRESDVFVFPSHMQSWGLAVFEAMSSGLPVIVSESAGASEVLTDTANALIVPPKSPERIADAVARLAADPALYAGLSASGRKFVEDTLSWERYATAMEKLFQDAIDAQLGVIPAHAGIQ